MDTRKDQRRTRRGRKRLVTALLAALISSGLVASAVAANVVGTAGKDTLRGGPQNDKLFGKGGNDKLLGLGGNDYLNGGPGNDVLTGGPGTDVLVCGAGSDIALADAKDSVGRDCESVKGVPKPVLSIADASTMEGNSGTTNLSFTVKLSRASAQPVSVSYATSDGTATSPGDYAATSGSLSFAAGQTSKAISVGVVADAVREENESFQVTLSNPVNASLAKSAATGTINNDDTAVPVTVGSYQGLLDGNAIFFDVNSDRSVSGFRSNYIREDCNDNAYIYGTVSWGSTHHPIADDATFAFGGVGTGTVAGSPAVFTDAVSGRFDGNNASGTYTASADFDYGGVHYHCSSGSKPWSASLKS